VKARLIIIFLQYSATSNLRVAGVGNYENG
jgi:hypothetical protein